MTKKRISLSKSARRQLLEGVNKISAAVVATLGPSGRNVLLTQSQDNPVSTKDGVSVAKVIRLEDPVEDIGAQLIKQASIKTAEQAGDGTTTSMLLAKVIFTEGMEILQSEDKVNPVEIKRGIDIAVNFVNDYLRKEYSKEITDEQQLRQVATISGNNDPQVGELIAAAIDSVGRDGVVTVEESRTGETYLETVEGIQFSRGFKSPYFVTDNSLMQAILTNPYILITDKRIVTVKELLPLLEGLSAQSKSLLVIADDIDGEALSTLIVNKMRGTLSCVAVKAPEFGDRKKALLEDIAILTGGEVISSEKGMRIEKVTVDQLGKAKKVTVGKDVTTIIDAQGDQEIIDKRAIELKQQIDNATSPFEKENLQDRLAKFIGGVAVVHVGGHTEVEMKEKKDRVEDALHATKAALEEGILPGGGSALKGAGHKLLDAITNQGRTMFTHPDQKIGAEIIVEACTQPFQQILRNAGYDYPEIETISREIYNGGDWKGFNPRVGQVVNMFEEGIIDPTKVVTLALENAASVAGTLLTTEAVVYDVEEKDKTSEVDPSYFS